MVKKIFATFFLLIFIPVALTTILVWNFRLTLFNKNFVKNELERGEVYSFVLNEGLELVVENLLGKDASKQLPVSSSEISGMIKEIVQEEYLKENTEKIIDQVLPYLASQTDSFRVEIELNELWDKANKSIDLLVAKKVKETKVCTIAQLQKLNLNESEGFPSCKPPNITDQEIVKQLDNKISAELLLLGSELQKDKPGKLIITQNGLEVEPKKSAFNNIFELKVNNQIFRESSSSGQEKSIFAQIRYFTSLYNQISLFLLIAALTILSSIALLRLPVLSSIFHWLGLSLAIPSVLIAGSLYISRTLVPAQIREITLQIGAQEFPAKLTPFLQKLFTQIFFDLTQPAFVASIVMVVIAIVLISMSKFIKPAQQKTSNQQGP